MNKKGWVLMALLLAGIALVNLFPRGDLHRAWRLIEDEQYTEAAILLEHMLLAEPDKPQLQWLYLEALVGAENADLIGQLYDKLDLTDISTEQMELLVEAAKTAEAAGRWSLTLDLWELAREAGYPLSEEQYQEIIYDAILYGDGHPDVYDNLDESDVRYQLAEWLAEERWFRHELIRRRTDATYASPVSYIDDEAEPELVEPWSDAAERHNHQLAHMGTLVKGLEPGLAWLNDPANLTELSPRHQELAADLAQDIGDCLAAVEWFNSDELPAMSGEQFLRIADSFLLVSDLSRLPWERLLDYYGDLPDVWYLYSLAEDADLEAEAVALHGNAAQDFTRPRWRLVVEASWGLPADDQFSYLWWSRTGNWLTLQGQAGTWILYSQTEQAEITLPGPVIWDWHSDALLIMSSSESGDVEYVHREHPQAPDVELDFTAFDEEVYPYFWDTGELFFPIQDQMMRYEIASGNTRPLTDTELWQMLRTQRAEPGDLDEIWPDAPLGVGLAGIVSDGSVLYDRYFHRLTSNYAFTGSLSAPGYADAIPSYEELPPSMRWRQPIYLLQEPDGSVGYIEPPAEKYMLSVSPQGDFAWMTEDKVYIGRIEPATGDVSQWTSSADR